MRKKSTYIIFIIVLFIFCGVMIYFFGGVDELKKLNNKTTLIVGKDTVWSYYDKKWHYLDSSSLKELDWKKYHIYLDNKQFGDYYLWHDDKWYAFDKNRNAVDLDGELLAYQSNFNIPVATFEKKEIADDTYINSILSDNNINETNQFTSKYVVSFDYDDDGEKEDFYVISNVFSESFHPDTVFSIVFMVDNGKIYSIYNDVSSNHSLNGCKPYFQSFIDVDQDKQYEFILSCGYYSNFKRSDMLFQFKNGNFEIVISN